MIGNYRKIQRGVWIMLVHKVDNEVSLRLFNKDDSPPKRVKSDLIYHI